MEPELTPAEHTPRLECCDKDWLKYAPLILDLQGANVFFNRVEKMFGVEIAGAVRDKIINQWHDDISDVIFERGIWFDDEDEAGSEPRRFLSSPG